MFDRLNHYLFFLDSLQTFSIFHYKKDLVPLHVIQCEMANSCIRSQNDVFRE